MWYPAPSSQHSSNLPTLSSWILLHLIDTPQSSSVQRYSVCADWRTLKLVSDDKSDFDFEQTIIKQALFVLFFWKKGWMNLGMVTEKYN